MTCSICKDAGKKIVIVKDSITGIPKTCIDWCVCTKSKIVSQSYNMLAWLEEHYIPENKIDPRLVFNLQNLRKNPNLLIRSPDYESFCLHIKSFIMTQRFLDPAPLIYCCRAIDILHKFYVQQEDKSSPHLSETNKYDLLIFSLDTEEKNDKLKTCLAQVAYTRLVTKIPTWIYIAKPTLESCVQEYSLELENCLKNYDQIMLSNVSIGTSKVRHTKNKSTAANFSGVSK